MIRIKKNNQIFIVIGLLLITTLTFITASETAYGPIISKDNYDISRSLIDRKITKGEIFEDFIIIKNKKEGTLSFSISNSESLSSILQFDINGEQIERKNSSEIPFIITGKEIGSYSGSVQLTGDIEEIIPVNITVVSDKLEPELFIEVNTNKKKYTPKSNFDFLVNLKKIRTGEINNIALNYSIKNTLDNKTYSLLSELKNITSSTQLRKNLVFPEKIPIGNYHLIVNIAYKNNSDYSQTDFIIKNSFLTSTLFGIIPIWSIILFFTVIILTGLAYYLIRRSIQNKKKYKMSLDYKSLATKNESSFEMGLLAETNKKAFYDRDRLTTHAVVAGATGGGKSIAAQVIVEEALLKNIAVLVFDPTAQWSGMLRKCDDKRMISFYPKFGLKANDARAFPGSVKLIQNSRQKIDISKYIQPGQIQIFALNKLDPSEMDVFVATVIASIFKSDPKEYPTLRVLLVFDEVHRLLPKFGGSGKGFLQIERACREFRKWGFGVLLVSQVLSDFVGEIKANINTEIQMRTRDESDLNRIKIKYDEVYLQSLIKASVGVGMFVNPSYNKGRPYFINFRPILHNTRRLSDEELEKYNKYTDIIEDIQYQIEQLEAEKIDVFDLKMELKLVKEKLMSGNFTVVDIYLEGLTPRLDKQWSSLGKKPKKKEIELIAEADVSASIAAAAKEREKWAKDHPEEAKKQATQEVSPVTKIVKPITFDNGMMLSSLQELMDIMPNFPKEIFSSNVKKDKNTIADWVSAQIDPALGEVLKPLTDKEAMSTEIAKYIKEKTKLKEETKEEVKQEKKNNLN